MALDELDIGSKLKAAARKAKLKSFESILSQCAPIGAISKNDLHTLKSAISKAVNKLPVITAFELSESRIPERVVRKLSLGCEVLDETLHGGIISRGITEVSGESASGKTQFCLQLSLTVQLPEDKGGLAGGAVYICTEDAFPSKRLYQMIQSFRRKHGANIPANVKLGDQIFIEHIADFDGLMSCFTQKVPVLLNSGQAKLIILDSVAAMFRSDYESHEMFKRAKHISTLATQLHQLGLQHNIPIVCVNQVTSSMNPEGRQLIPSLGLTWSNQITTRIMLSRTEQIVSCPPDGASGIEHVGTSTLREMEIMFAPHLPTMTVPYVIDQEGMKGLR